MGFDVWGIHSFVNLINHFRLHRKDDTFHPFYPLKWVLQIIRPLSYMKFPSHFNIEFLPCHTGTDAILHKLII